jgi:hypothetical protein
MSVADLLTGKPVVTIPRDSPVTDTFKVGFFHTVH